MMSSLLQLVLIFLSLAVLPSSSQQVHVPVQSTELVSINTFLYNVSSEFYLLTKRTDLHYKLIPSTQCSVFNVTSSTGLLFTQESINITDADSSTDPLTCISTDTDQYPVLSSYNCFIVGSTDSYSYGLVVNVHVLPTVHHSLPLSIGGEAVGGLENVPLELDGFPLLVDYKTESNELANGYLLLNASDSFSINITTASCYSVLQLVTTRPLSVGTSYNLTLYHTPTQSGTQILVNVVGGNRYPPVFMDVPSSVTISELSPVGSLVTAVTAFDNDTNGYITYTLYPLSSNFIIHHTTGLVYLSQPLDYESSTFTNITVIASDGSYPVRSIEISISIFITDANEVRPAIDIQQPLPGHHEIINDTILVPESTTTGSILARFVLTDEDSLHISINMDCRTCHNCFTLSLVNVTSNTSNTGNTSLTAVYNLLLTSGLDYEGYTDTHVILINATDNGAPPLTTLRTINIQLKDTNDPPLFPSPSYEGRVSSGSPIGTNVLFVTATDQDAGDNGTLVYAMVNGSESFTIHPSTGLVSVHSSSLIPGLVFINVSVRDTGPSPLYDYTSLTVLVTESDTHPPVFPNPYPSTSVSEYWNQSLPLYHFNASDPNTGCSGSVHYSLLYSEPPLFYIDQVSGLLYLNDSLDHELSSTARVSVSARSLGNSPDLVSMATLTITIQDEDDSSSSFTPSCPCSPVFLTPLYAGVVREDAGTGVEVLRVRAVDYDQGDVISYSTSGSADVIDIDSSTGQITLASTLDRDIDYISFNVIATDQTSSSSSVPVHLKVLHVTNSNRPSFLSPSNGTIINVTESTSTNQVLITISATDHDIGVNAELRYWIRFGNEHGLFYLDSVTGEVWLTRPLDYETDPHSYTLIFDVTDLSSSPLDTGGQLLTVTLNLLDINDHFPVFTQPRYDCYIEEGSSDVRNDNGSSGCRIEAIDSDSINNDTTYSINGSGSSYFNIGPTTGLITVKDSIVIDYERNHLFVLIVTAADGGTPPHYSTCPVYIRVINVNDNPLQFIPSLFSVYLPLQLPANATLFNAHAFDRDGTNITYSLLGDGTSYTVSTDGLVSIDRVGPVDPINDTVKIISLGPDSNGRTNDYNLYYLPGLNFNSLPPQFIASNPPLVSIPHRATNGTHLVTMVTWDPDRGLDGVPRYYIIGGTGAGYFAIHKTNGSIVTGRELSALTTPTLSLVVMATDSGPHPQFSLFNLTVAITDDHKVFIESPVYNYTISDKYSFTGHTFGYVHVPVHDGRVLNYVIPPAQEILPFAINRSTGGLSVNGTLDRQWYSFRTVASDSTESTVSVINVRVLDTVNNFRPEFPPHFSTILLPASFPLNTSFIRLFVTDGDNDNNADSSYSILAPPNSPIGVVPTSGELFLLTTPSFNSTVITIRANNVDLFSDFNISITLFHADTNTDFDLISNNNDSILVPESVGIGSVIYTLPGSSDGRPLLYYLTNNDDDNDKFTVHSGDVHVTGSMDYEAQQHYTLVFTINDGSNNNKYFTLNVTLTDVNDNPSYFSEDNFVFSLPEDSPLNYVIGSINITDSDSVTASNVFYSIIDWLHPLSSSLFNITSSGVLVLTGPLDRETLPSHTLTVAVLDGQFEQLTRVTINVKDADDNPPLFTGLPLTLVVPEDRSLGDIVTIVTAFDLDDPLNTSPIVYSLSGSHQILDLPFQVESSTGVISINGSLNYESVTSYNLYITAASSTNPSSYSTHSLSILVSNIIDTFPVLYGMEVSVYENQSSSNYVTNIGASPPPPHPVTYSIVNGNDLGHLYIEEYTGTIRTLVPLDRETVDYYNLTVRGSYSDQYYTDVSVLITVLDINDNNPSVSVSNLTFLVSEDANVSNQVIFDLNPIDLDQGNNGSIRSILILDSESDTIFDIDTSGHCTLKRQLDREEKEIHQFNILLIDNGHTHPLYSTYLITILVTDVNDNDPVFSQYQSILVVSGPILSNEVLYRFTATDTDGGANGTIQGYFISGGSGEGVFNIDPLTGDLRGLELFEMESNYSLMIGAVDGGDRRSIINISLIISYCRFNELSFTPPSYDLSVAEDTPPSSLLLSPSITDFNSPGVFRYSLSVHDDQFMINTSTGSLSLLSSPDRELTPVHYLVLIVQDISANMLRVAKATVTVTISDVNDNAPTFIGLPYAVYLSDTQEIGSHVFTVLASDADTDNNSVISYYIISDPISVLGINSSTGVLYYNQTIDPAITDIHITVVIGAADNGHPQLSTNTTLRLTLINSNAPNFSAPLYTATLPEDTAAGTTVVRLLAEPRTDGALLFYSITDTGDVRFPFSINPESGLITVNDRGLDYETTPSYSFTVQAEEIRTGLYSQATVQVSITDINDQVPSFTQSSYIINIPETISKGSTVLTVEAADGDTPPNAQVTYSLSPSTSFTIDPSTGDVTTNSTLDYEVQTSYQLTLVASDSGDTPLEGSASLRIIVTNVNDNPPVFIPLSPISVSEGADPGTVVTFIRAMDADNNEIIYSIIPEQDGGHSNFQLLTNGLLRLNPQNVSLTDIQYTLNVSASDGVHVIFTSVTIDIDDINDHSPAFNQSEYSASVVENSPSGVGLIRVNATDSDRDINAEITYSMIGSLFTIDQKTGLISTSSSNIDRESTPTHSLIIIARDGGGLTDTATVVISVVDVNDNSPSFTQSLYGALVAEGDDYNNHQVLTVLARDPDDGINGSITYNIVTSHFNLFHINPSTGAVSVTGSLNYETNSSYSFNITATDGGGRVSEVAIVTINITNVADTNPYYSQSVYHLLIPEDTPTGPFYQPHVTFAEECTPSGYSIFGKGNGPFSYNSNGYITLNGLLDREDTDFYTFFVTVQCVQINLLTNPPTFQTRFGGSTINITITDVNERPVITSALYISSIISEGSSINSTVTIVQAVDTDLGLNGTVQYRLGSSDTPFSVDTVSGALLVSGTLDREQQQLYTLNVIAYDLGSPSLSSSATVIIAIQDINDNPPSFICTNDTSGVLIDSHCHYSISIPEDVELNQLILTLGTNDSDITGSTSFLLNSTVFNITSTSEGNGVIRTGAGLDRETNDHYELRVIANDGVFTVEAFLSVIITDINDNRPLFSTGEYVVDIIENYPTLTVFIRLNATDEDYGNNSIITYTLLTNPSSANVSLNSSTGEVSFLISPDHETANRLEYYIRASDIGGLEDLATLTINIIDINDNTPVFTGSNYTASIYENTTANVEVLLVSATDSDSGSNALIRYDIDLESSQYFTIDTVSGLVRARAHLIDRERNELFNILVTARDSGEELSLHSSTNVTVFITDINDNPPLFADTAFTVFVYENASVDTVIHSFTVTDDDEGVNAQVSYDIAGTGKESFLLQATPTGLLLKVNGELNSESVELYSLVLTATDGGIPALKTSVLINIHVLDQNEHLPTFNRPLYTFTIPEDEPSGSIIGTITASDLDPADSNLTYRFKGSVSDFSVNERTGKIRIGGRGLDFERVRNYTLILLAIEPRPLSPQTAQTVIEITVTDINDNPPAFLCSHDHTHCMNHSYSVRENTDNVILGRMRVIDADTVTDPNQIRFSIASGGVDINNRTLFSIDSITGNLSLLSPLDREERDSYVVMVTASDGGTPSLTGSAQVLIRVTDVNDNSPRGGVQYIIINLLSGDLGSLLNEAVFTNDSDIVNNYTLTVTGGVSDEITINDGLITSISIKLTPGQYSLPVGITDVLYNGTIVHTRTLISIIINDISPHVQDNSFTLLLSEITPLVFLSDFLIDFNTTLTSLLIQELNQLIQVSYIDIKPAEGSVIPAGTLLTISVCYNDSSCIEPDLVQHFIHSNKETINNINIVSVDVNDCSNEPCANNGLCSGTVEFSLSKSFVTSPHLSYLGLVTKGRSTCTCFSGFTGDTCSEPCSDCNGASLCDRVTCPTDYRCVINDRGRPVCVDDCNPSPCLNGGRCIPQDPGHHCSCPLGYDGPNCEQTMATFNGQSHVLFPSLPLVSSGSISFEIITNESEGVLLYGGHFDVGFNDSLLIHVINNSLMTSVSFGGYEYQLIVNEFPINMKEWITVTFEYNINFMQLKVATFDDKYQQKKTRISNLTHNNHFLDLTTPITLGRLLPQYVSLAPPTLPSIRNFQGCMKNVDINGHVLDFSAPLLAEDLEQDCQFTDINCNRTPCNNSGTCIGEWEGFTCTCTDEYTGVYCDEKYSTGSFTGDVIINYELLLATPTSTDNSSPTKGVSRLYSRGSTDIYLLISTTQTHSSVILQLGDTEYTIIEIIDEFLQARVSLGGGRETRLLINKTRINDDRGHMVTFTRKEGAMTLILDDTYTAKNYLPTTNNISNDVLLDVSHLSVGGANTSNGRGYTGCIRKMRLDGYDIPVRGENEAYKANSDTSIEQCPDIEEPTPPPITTSPISSLYVVTGLALLGLLLISVSALFVCKSTHYWYNKKKGTVSISERRFIDYPSTLPSSTVSSVVNSRRTFGLQSTTSFEPLDVTGHYGYEAYRPLSPRPPSPLLFPPSELKPSVTEAPPISRPTVAPPTVRNDTRSPSSASDSVFEVFNEYELGPASPPPRDNNKLATPPSPPSLPPPSPPPPPPLSFPPSVVSKSSEALDPMTGMPVSHDTSQESLTPHTEDDGRSTLVDGEDIGRYVKKRLMCADILVNDINYDTSTSFDTEGPYSPLGSIGSLYDILQDNDTNYKYNNNVLQDESTPRSVKAPPTQISHLLLVPTSPTSPKRPSPLLQSRQWRDNNGVPLPPPVRPKPLRKNQTTSTTDIGVSIGVSKVAITDSGGATGGAVPSAKDLSSSAPPPVPIKKQATKPTPSPLSPPLFQAVRLQPLSVTSSLHQSSRDRPLPHGPSVVPSTDNKRVLVPVKFSSPKRSSGDTVKTTRGGSSIQNRATQRMNNFTGEFNTSQESDV